MVVKAERDAGFLLAERTRRLNNLPARSLSAHQQTEVRHALSDNDPSVFLPLRRDRPLQPISRSIAAGSLWPPRLRTSSGKDPVIAFTGVCAGPIVIRTEGVTLQGVGEAVIDGGGQDAVTIAGAGRVSLNGIEVRNGLNGIVAVNGAHLSLSSLNVHNNLASGISVQTGSSAVLSEVTTAQNGLHGLDVHSGSAATVNGALNATGNRVFGINVNGSSMTLSQATVSATGNALGIQIATNANAFLADADSVINANNNLATGLTIVSGARLVSFGGTINASGNPGSAYR